MGVLLHSLRIIMAVNRIYCAIQASTSFPEDQERPGARDRAARSCQGDFMRTRGASQATTLLDIKMSDHNLYIINEL